MFDKFKKSCALCVVILLMLGMGISTQAASYETYTYSYEGQAVSSPDAYLPGKILDFFSEECGVLNQPQDVFVAPDRTVYLADTGNNRIIQLDADLGYLRTIAEYIDEDGNPCTFLAPSGVFVTEQGLLYVADSDSAQILILDDEGHLQGRIVSPKGSGVPADFTFQPYSLVVDKRGRSYVISLHNTAGVMTFEEDGTFTGFIGAQNTTPTFTDIFLRLFMTKEQRSRMKSAIPAEYSNIAIDREGFFYVTDATLDQGQLMSLISSRSTGALHSPIKKLNPTGVDVMTRTGFFPPVGDIKITFGVSGDEYGGSKISDVAICDNGLFSLADSRRNKIFTYDGEGNLLYAFAGKGFGEGQFVTLTSIAYHGNDLLALDAQSGTLTQFRLTQYGQFINQAIDLYTSNDFDGAAKMWNEVAAHNNNLDLAYISVGKNLYNSGKYQEAMEYFKSASDVTNYSRAMGKYREKWMEQYFFLIPLILIVAVVGGVKLFSLINRKNIAGDYTSRHHVGTHLLYAQRVLLHPFDAFYQIKFRGRGGVLSATVLVVGAVLAYLAYSLFSGYVFRFSTMDGFTLLTGIATVLLPRAVVCSGELVLYLPDGRRRQYEADLYFCLL